MNSIINEQELHLLNYLSVIRQLNYCEQFTMIQFVEMETDYACFGIELNGKNYVSASISDSEILRVYAGYPKEQEQIDKGYKFIMRLMGNDDTSFIRRFKTRNDMFMFLKEHKNKMIKIDDFLSTENPFLMID